MSTVSNHIRQAGGILSEILMLVFIFASSWSHVQHRAPAKINDVIITVAETEDFAFIDSSSSTEVLISFIGKAVFIGELLTEHVRVPLTEYLPDSEQLKISPSLFNTFYTHITTKAP